MQTNSMPVWKSSPFFRLIIPLMGGVIVQWYLQVSILLILLSITSFLSAFLLFYFLPVEIRFRLQYLQGILLMLIIFCFAMFRTWHKDIRHQQNWYGHYYNDSSCLLVSINEPLSEKTRSYKAEANVEAVINKTGIHNTEGKIFLYFSKDSSASDLQYGESIFMIANLKRLKNSGNPGAFNFERYGAFQQMFHSSYLTPKDWVLSRSKKINRLRRFIFFIQSVTISTLKKYIKGDKEITGIAEALLIGYKQDLDKDLVQAYSNAGVVHIIAISGLHLGLIYIVLIWIFSRIPIVKDQKLLRVLLVLGCLWFFSLLTGASASVLRSAVMFTCIMIGKDFFRQTSIYNALAASAFLLLIFDPYYLWDVGFQLSYLAIIGIVALQKPIENCFYFRHIILQKCWGMLAVTFAAQIITFPICIYYFHQFPNLFFITNLIAVPLSTIILFAEIALIAFSWIPFVGLIIGAITGWLLWLMNFIIKTSNNIPFSLLDNIYANLLTTLVLYFIVIGTSAWLVNKNKNYFRMALLSLLVFALVHAWLKVKTMHQKKIIIYNIPKHQAIDFIYQDKFYFKGDSSLITNQALHNFYLKPARISLQAYVSKQQIAKLNHNEVEWQFFGKNLIIVDSTLSCDPLVSKIKTDILLITDNPHIKIADILTVFAPSIIVFDSSNSLWKIATWEKDCLALALPCFSIPQEGAYILDIE